MEWRFIILTIFFIFHQCNSWRFPKPQSKSPSSYPYDTKFFDVKLSHFSFGEERTFKMRYLINTKYWEPGKPIFFYTGNEGDISVFAENTGFMWEYAPDFNAMILFAEHRFYGQSMPCGNDSLTNIDCYKHLTSEEALADYVELLSYLKTNISGASNSPVIAFGGSYGGMLAAWMRIKYPNIIFGSLAASAPIWQFTNLTDCSVFSQITTQAYKTKGSQSCVDKIRLFWNAIDQLVKTEQGRSILSLTFQLCTPLKSPEDGKALKDYVNELIIDAAMGNYPYPAEFLGPWPAWPVTEFCKAVDRGSESSPLSLATATASAVFALTNYSGTFKCLDLSDSGSSFISADAWPIQTCNEMVMPMCSNGVTDMFEVSPWSLDDFTRNCQKNFKITPDARWIEKVYWGKNIIPATNIIFSNGGLDPWSGGGVLIPLTTRLPIVSIPNGAHHLDLRAPNPADPSDVVQARTIELFYLNSWLDHFYSNNLKKTFLFF